MGKIGILIGNEVLKLRRRKTLLIMLIILLVVCLGYQFLMGTIMNLLMDSLTYDSGVSLQAEAKSALEDLQGKGGPDATDKFDRRQWYYYTEIQACKIETDDWRYQSGLLDSWADAAAEKTSEEPALHDILEQNDYKASYRYLIAQSESIYGTTPTLAEAINWGYQYCLDHDIPPLNDDWRCQKALVFFTAVFQK